MGTRSAERDAFVRWVVGVVASAVVFALAGVIATSVINRGVWEQATIGLTAASEWPLHDVHLATTAGALDDPELVDSVRLRLGLPNDTTVELDRQRQAGNGVVTVAARAGNAADAASLANAVAEEMIVRVSPATPVELVDRADGTRTRSSTTAVAASGVLIGLVVGLVVWSPPRRRTSEA